ncbi:MULTISPECIES: MgtC/SapB family protein [Cyanophyceae]|uniref:MgtC/SapB family protein n=1 Tax=Cyanophyceae TaxID=3028117 RepID=UPI001688814F|nr:MgtC/SapB family protein [Trichocoleus sp. FACHB-69]MBD1932882.1 MgtC/SapB family protein [Trichocoleus sp. FACHB-69]
MSQTYLLSPNDWLGISFRLCFAMLVGAIIGIERELKNKPAGLRTHMLVSFGAALLTLIPLLVDENELNSDALSRVIQGITAGIGFLGAGEILRESQQESRKKIKIHGLTSAAAIWVSAALGIAAGCGLWQISLIGALLCFLVLRVFKKVEPHS